MADHLFRVGSVRVAPSCFLTDCLAKNERAPIVDYSSARERLHLEAIIVPGPLLGEYSISPLHQRNVLTNTQSTSSGKRNLLRLGQNTMGNPRRLKRAR